MEAYIGFIELMLSTFLGFGSAILVETIIEKRKKKSYEKQLLKDMKQELLSLKDNLEILNFDKVFIRPYNIPVWRGACDSGALLNLDNKPFFSKLIEVYSCIEEANMIETKCFELYVSRHVTTDINLITATFTDNRKYVRNQIEIGLRIIGEVIE